jgi:Domain of unknown function (DUF4198)
VLSTENLRRTCGWIVKWRRPALCLGFGLITAWSVAQESWLAPRRFIVPPGTRQYVGRFIGADFAPHAWDADSRKFRSVLHLVPGVGVMDITTTATARDTLTTTLPFARPGTHVVALRSTEALFTQAGPTFNNYLKDAGLTTVLALRTSRNDLDKPAREGASRCLKTLVSVVSPQAASLANPADTLWHHRIGLPLELIPEQNPYRLRSGDTLSVKVVLRRGQPAAGQLVQIWQQSRQSGEKSAPPLRLRTDLRGLVRFRLKAAAAVLVSCVRMTPHPALDSAEWQSTWSSLTFGGPAH